MDEVNAVAAERQQRRSRTLARKLQPYALELAEAMCLSSHHGLTKTAWPCAYHERRAANTLAALRGDFLPGAPTGGQEP